MKKIEAQKEYMKLNGEQRLALMIMLDVENNTGSEAYEACILYIIESGCK